mmetsp:Transcript_105237/g.181881  ORF Transcript_105237/g.181881 Transcript_105237/m.181881 type:complete len:253 (+) Transcript_105237:229-987(+)
MVWSSSGCNRSSLASKPFWQTSMASSSLCSSPRSVDNNALQSCCNDSSVFALFPNKLGMDTAVMLRELGCSVRSKHSAVSNCLLSAPAVQGRGVTSLENCRLSRGPRVLVSDLPQVRTPVVDAMVLPNSSVLLAVLLPNIAAMRTKMRSHRATESVPARRMVSPRLWDSAIAAAGAALPSSPGMLPSCAAIFNSCSQRTSTPAFGLLRLCHSVWASKPLVLASCAAVTNTCSQKTSTPSFLPFNDVVMCISC